MSRDAGIENTLWIRIAYLKSATEALRNEAEHITPESLQGSPAHGSGTLIYYASEAL
jgi:hypothetical protein